MERKKFINYLREGYYFATYSLPGSGQPNVLFINSRLHFLFFPYFFSLFLNINIMMRKSFGWEYSMPPIVGIVIMIFLIFTNKLIFDKVFGPYVEKGVINEAQPKKEKRKKGIIALLFFLGGFISYILFKELIIIPFFL